MPNRTYSTGLAPNPLCFCLAEIIFGLTPSLPPTMLEKWLIVFPLLNIISQTCFTNELELVVPWSMHFSQLLASALKAGKMIPLRKHFEINVSCVFICSVFTILAQWKSLAREYLCSSQRRSLCTPAGPVGAASVPECGP